MVDPKGINFDMLERIRSVYTYRRLIVTGRSENPYQPDAQYPVEPKVAPLFNEYRCKKYGYHRTFENSILCPDCGSELY